MCNDTRKHTRFGASVEHGDAHEQDHASWSRRDFMSRSGIFALGSALMLNRMPVSVIGNKHLNSALTNPCNDRILVMIRLDGGNDGLNTIIPATNPRYWQLRNVLRIQNSQSFALDADHRMPNVMMPLQSMWNEGHMKVIHNVGYPQPNYSHFRSYDIWASGTGADEYEDSGWLGRYLDSQYEAFEAAPPMVPPAIQIGVHSNLLFKGDNSDLGLAVSSPAEFYELASTGRLYNNQPQTNKPRHLELAYARTVANGAYRYAQSIHEAYNAGSNAVSYPNSAQNLLAHQLSIVARLIKGNLGTRFFLVQLAGFDTHADQMNMHLDLLGKVSNAIKLFYDDLGATGNKVAAMTFSEFGRTIQENATAGTDHGTGAPILFFSKNNGNGFLGTPPNLNADALDDNEDPIFSTDFRDVYASLLQNWLCVDPTVAQYILGDAHQPLPDLLPPSAPDIGANNVAALHGHQPAAVNGSYVIKYAIKSPGNMRLTILDKSGHILRTLEQGLKSTGSYSYSFVPAAWSLPSGEYIYRLDINGKMYWRPIKF